MTHTGVRAGPLRRHAGARARSAAIVVALAAAAAGAQENLGFESGTEPWDLDAAPHVAIAGEPRHAGAASLRIEHEGSGAADRIDQTFAVDARNGDRLRIEAFVKPSLDGDGVVSLWVRVDGPAGLLYVDRASDRGARGTGDWRSLVVEAPLHADAREVRFGAEFRGAGVVWLDDFAVSFLHARELPPISADRRRYVERALDVIEASSLRHGAIDWAALRADVLAQARGADDIATAYLALRYGLTALDDGHSYLMTPAQMKSLAAAPVGNARRGSAAAAPHAELVAPMVGYLAVPGFAGGTQLDQADYAERLQAHLATLESAGACRTIIDLRGNRGGNLWPMLAGLGPIVGDGEVLGAIHPDGRRRSIWYRDGQAGLDEAVQLRVRGTPFRPGAAARATAVLTDAGTASAAEMLLIAIRGGAVPARSFGAATAGATTATRIFTLSDGAALVLAVAATVDAHGNPYPGPIAPDEDVLTETQGRALVDQPAVRAARDWLESLGPCAAVASR